MWPATPPFTDEAQERKRGKPRFLEKSKPGVGCQSAQGQTVGSVTFWLRSQRLFLDRKDQKRRATLLGRLNWPGGKPVRRLECNIQASTESGGRDGYEGLRARYRQAVREGLTGMKESEPDGQVAETHPRGPARAG